MKIIILARTNGFAAYPEGHPELYGFGKCQADAVSDLLFSFSTQIGVTLWEHKIDQNNNVLLEQIQPTIECTT